MQPPAHAAAAAPPPPTDPVLPSPPLPRDSWATDGFVIVRALISRSFASLLNGRLERILRGEYETGVPPDKAPRLLAAERGAPKPGKPAPLPLGGPSKRTLQIINVWKSDGAFAALVTSPTLGRMVAQLAGWPAGARVANDQVRASPPPAGDLGGDLGGHLGDDLGDVTAASPRQVWAKPPGGAPLTFHRDGPYFDFVPSDVVTVRSAEISAIYER